MKNKLVKRIITLLLAGVLTFTGIFGINTMETQAAEYGVSNPQVNSYIGKIIEFGSYLQDDTTGNELVDEKDGTQPIQWRILEQNENELFLISDKVLDVKPFHNESKDIAWENCNLRSWLNDEFYHTAFSPAEQEAICLTQVYTSDHPDRIVTGGCYTEDKIYLLSMEEAANPAYGFLESIDVTDQSRMGKVTAYADYKGYIKDIDLTLCWWLRSPDRTKCYVSGISDSGALDNCGVEEEGGVRPVLRVDAANDIIISALANVKDAETVVRSTTWDTVKFGTVNGEKISWRVLSVKDNEALLLADCILADGAYNGKYKSVTWEKSDIRSWLNKDFYQTAFSLEEQAAICPKNLENVDNPYYKTKGGKDTVDSVFLLSIEDFVNIEYGFPSMYEYSHNTRKVVSTSSNYDESFYSYWLRSSGSVTTKASQIYSYGAMRIRGDSVDTYDVGVRPALYLDLSSAVWEKGTPVSSEDKLTATNSVLPEIYHEYDLKKIPAKVKSLKVTKKENQEALITFKKTKKTTGYQIQRSLSKNFNKKRKTYHITETSFSLKLSKGKTYYFRVRAYKQTSRGRRYYYGKWSTVKKIKM